MKCAFYFLFLLSSNIFANDQMLLDFTEELLSDLNSDNIVRLECPDLKQWRPLNCQELSEEIRDSILELSMPDNFPKTKYRKAYSLQKSVEEETDCSRFIFHVFKRAGLYYPMATTKNFSCLSVFKEVLPQEAQAGDIVLMRGHMGILSREGKLVSATSGRRSRWKGSSIRELSLKSFRGKKRYFTWSCPESGFPIL